MKSKFLKIVAVLSSLLILLTQTSAVAESSSSTTKEEALEALKRIDQKRWEYAQENNFASYKALFSQGTQALGLEDEFKNYRSMVTKSGYKKSNVYILSGSNGLYCGQAVRYYVDYDGELHYTRYHYAVKKNENGKWVACYYDDDFYKAFNDFSEYQGTLPEYYGIADADANGRKVMTTKFYMYMVPNMVFDGCFSIHGEAIWQNEDGSVDVLVAMYNGDRLQAEGINQGIPRKAKLIQVVLFAKDGSQIFNKKVEYDNLVIPSGENKIVIIHVDESELKNKNVNDWYTIRVGHDIDYAF